MDGPLLSGILGVCRAGVGFILSSTVLKLVAKWAEGSGHSCLRVGGRYLGILEWLSFSYRWVLGRAGLVLPGSGLRSLAIGVLMGSYPMVQGGR